MLWVNIQSKVLAVKDTLGLKCLRGGTRQVAYHVRTICGGYDFGAVTNRNILQALLYSLFYIGVEINVELNNCPLCSENFT